MDCEETKESERINSLSSIANSSVTAGKDCDMNITLEPTPSGTSQGVTGGEPFEVDLVDNGQSSKG